MYIIKMYYIMRKKHMHIFPYMLLPFAICQVSVCISNQNRTPSTVADVRCQIQSPL